MQRVRAFLFTPLFDIPEPIKRVLTVLFEWHDRVFKVIFPFMILYVAFSLLVLPALLFNGVALRPPVPWTVVAAFVGWGLLTYALFLWGVHELLALLRSRR